MFNNLLRYDLSMSIHKDTFDTLCAHIQSQEQVAFHGSRLGRL